MCACFSKPLMNECCSYLKSKCFTRNCAKIKTLQCDMLSTIVLWLKVFLWLVSFYNIQVDDVCVLRLFCSILRCSIFMLIILTYCPILNKKQWEDLYELSNDSTNEQEHGWWQKLLITVCPEPKNNQTFFAYSDVCLKKFVLFSFFKLFFVFDLMFNSFVLKLNVIAMKRVWNSLLINPKT